VDRVLSTSWTDVSGLGPLRSFYLRVSTERRVRIEAAETNTAPSGVEICVLNGTSREVITDGARYLRAVPLDGKPLGSAVAWVAASVDLASSGGGGVMVRNLAATPADLVPDAVLGNGPGEWTVLSTLFGNVGGSSVELPPDTYLLGYRIDPPDGTFSGWPATESGPVRIRFGTDQANNLAEFSAYAEGPSPVEGYFKGPYPVHQSGGNSAVMIWDAFQPDVFAQAVPGGALKLTLIYGLYVPV
jgi:hypothetical protein